MSFVFGLANVYLALKNDQCIFCVIASMAKWTINSIEKLVSYMKKLKMKWKKVFDISWWQKYLLINLKSTPRFQGVDLNQYYTNVFLRLPIKSAKKRIFQLSNLLFILVSDLRWLIYYIRSKGHNCVFWNSNGLWSRFTVEFSVYRCHWKSDTIKIGNNKLARVSE